MKQTKVIVTVSCDRCGKPDAETYTEMNSKGRPVEIDLDKPCRAELDEMQERYDEVVRQASLILNPIRELADKYGVRSGKDQPKPKQTYTPTTGERVCILCWVTRDTDATIKSHFQTEHGLSESMTEAYGHHCPVDGDEFDRIGHHIRQGHKELGFTHYSQAFLWAKNNGDPHDVLARQVAALKKLAKAA